MVTRLQEIPAEFADEDTIFEAFAEYCRELGIEPYPAQEEAMLAILSGDNTIVATPTGSGEVPRRALRALLLVHPRHPGVLHRTAESARQ